jgi:telomere length regulation protein
LPQSEQPKVIISVLDLLAETRLKLLGSCDSPAAKAVISAAAGVIYQVVGPASPRMDHLASWLTRSSGAGVGYGVGIRRAVLAVVSQDKELITSILEKCLDQFGDPLYIKHSPILQQESQFLSLPPEAEVYC